MNTSNPKDRQRRQFARDWYAGLDTDEKRQADKWISEFSQHTAGKPQALETLFCLKLWVMKLSAASGDRCGRLTN